jgi:hypothetical protein
MQVHLLTFIIIILFAGIFLGLNFKIRHQVAPFDERISWIERGWPVTFQKWDSEGKIHEGIWGPALALDVFLGTVVLILIATVCELWLTRPKH